MSQPYVSRAACALLPLRVMIGFGFAMHGYAKLHRGPEKFAIILVAIGVPMPHLTAWVTALLEFFAGILMMAGAYVSLLALPMSIIMLTALFTVHFRYGFSSITLKAVTTSGAEFGPVGYELNLLYIAGIITLALSGAGAFSVDRWRDHNRRKAASRRETKQNPGVPAISLVSEASPNRRCTCD